MISIKPRKGSKIEFNVWALFGSPPPENQAFTGVMVGKIKSNDGVLYIVNRDYDGACVTVPRDNLVGYANK